MVGARARTEEGQDYKGIGVSPGVVIGPVYVMGEEEITTVERSLAAEEVDAEICRFESALIETRRQIKGIQHGLNSSNDRRDSAILDAHLMVLDDRILLERIVDRIRKLRRNAEFVVRKATDEYAGALAAVEDDYLRERVVDVKDVGRRLIRNLSASAAVPAERMSHKHIVIARDLSPSETASLRKDMVVGFATDLGSPTSHTAVMARALEIPAIVGLHDISTRVQTGDEALIDGNKGVLIVNPSAEQLKRYGKVAAARKTIENGLTNLRDRPAETADGYKIVLSANVEDATEAQAVIDYGAEGIGLFRSEYLYMLGEDFRDEDGQEGVYRYVAEKLAPAPVIIRTADFGGDKFYGDSGSYREANPFLGCRSIRISLREEEVFRTQLRAILRSNVKGNVKIMYPMISSVEEVIRANELLEHAKRDLGDEVPAKQKDIEVGVMIEIPSAAMTADVIAEHVQFFSIGTNDLIQYTIAVDRVNERVAYLYEPTHPAVIKLIKLAIDAGHRRGIWVGVCGEMAADPLLAPLLVGLGIDELSVAPSAVPLVKDAVRSVRYSAARRLAEKALACKSAVEVLGHCRKLTRKTAPEILELV